MTAEIVEFPGVTRFDLPAEKVLNFALKEDLDTVIIIGTKKDGEFYFAGNKSDGGEVNWWLDTAKRKLMDITL